MKYLLHREILGNQMESLSKRGGPYKIAADKVYSLMGKIDFKSPDPFKGLNVTKNGETRIKHCIKYDLNAACRLVTIKDNGVHAMVFLGDHQETDNWLDANIGYTLTIDGTELKGLKVTPNIKEVSTTRVSGKITNGTLLSQLADNYLDIILDNVNAKTFKKLENISTYTSEDEILEICHQINIEGIAELTLDVLLYLKSDNLDGAKNRILYYNEDLKKLENASSEEIESVKSGEEFILLEDLNEKEIESQMNESSWLNWMLFMHPQQRVVVNEDFSGSSRLLGVSGSGKTCVSVNRAIRLAKKYLNEKILITTINPSLANLINNLVDGALSLEKDKQLIRKQIVVKAFSDVKRELLLHFEEDPLKKRSINEYSDKHSEDVDKIWKEFYLRQNNNPDATVLESVHSTLLNRNILPLQYIKEEFDWIRSALTIKDRHEYLNIERDGRAEPLTKDYRESILKGLEYWERKMSDIGVSDYLGLIDYLDKYIDLIQPKFRCILVDELQDFGTTELRIIRKLVAKGENDIFLCGDIAQRVHTKHHKLSLSGIQISPNAFRRINKNYRNSKQILEAAANVLLNNINIEDFNSSDFELIEPSYANFSTPKPFLRGAKSFYEELDYSIKYLIEYLDEKEKGCIAVCGYTHFQINDLGKQLNLEVLNGNNDLSNNKVFLSDLTQTKGFDFDKVIIVNCGKGILPNDRLPEKESFRDISKLYVAMTRAKKELIISYSSGQSEIFNNSLHLFNVETNWSEYIDIKETKITEEAINRTYEEDLRNILESNGYEFLYSDLAMGLSKQSQDKIIALVNRKKSSDHNGNPDGWINMYSFINSLNQSNITPHMNRLLGRNIYKELKEKFPVR